MAGSRAETASLDPGLEELLSSLACAGSVKDLGQRVTDALPSVLDVDSVAVYRLARGKTRSEDEPELRCVCGLKEERLRAVAHRALAARVCVLDDAAFAVPLMHEANPVGVLAVARSDGRPLAALDQNLASRLGQTLAAAIVAREAFAIELHCTARATVDTAGSRDRTEKENLSGVSAQTAEAARRLARPLANLAAAVHEAEGHLRSDPDRARARLRDARSYIEALRGELASLTHPNRKP